MAELTCKACGAIDPSPKTKLCPMCSDDKKEDGVLRLNKDESRQKANDDDEDFDDEE